MAKFHEPMGKAREDATLGAIAPAAIGDIRMHPAPAMDLRRLL